MCCFEGIACIDLKVAHYDRDVTAVACILAKAGLVPSMDAIFVVNPRGAVSRLTKANSRVLGWRCHVFGHV